MDILPYKLNCYKYVFICIPNLVQEGSGTNDEFGKYAEDLKKPTKDASKVNTSDIVPEQPRIMTAGKREETHNIQSMHVGPDDNLTSQPNEAMKNTDSTTSLQVQQSPVGRCIGNKFQIRLIFYQYFKKICN